MTTTISQSRCLAAQTARSSADACCAICAEGLVRQFGGVRAVDGVDLRLGRGARQDAGVEPGRDAPVGERALGPVGIGRLGLDLDEQLLSLLPPLRASGGVVVAAA